MNKPRNRKWRTVLILGLVFFAGIQLIRPSVGNPQVTGDLQAPPEVKQILKRACYDCHSNETKLAWFDELAPAYWMVVKDIREARGVLNFSHWDSLTADQQKAKLFEAFNKITFKEMPLKSYRLLHAGAAITNEEEAVIKNYLGTLVSPVGIPDSAKRNAAEDQYKKWIEGSTVGKQVNPVPNGIEFMSDYNNWVPISTTDRFDNGTMRVILGNDQAVKAIKERHINPWPDGAIFAKLAWDQSPDSTGNIHTGAFKQVEFMIRDSRKYASSDGWGWARWVKGTQLAPYGKNALFVTECMNCHKPMQDRDFMFTSPLDFAPGSGDNIQVMGLYNEEASLPDNTAFNPLTEKLIGSSVDRNNKTMSTLYGNDIAAKFARTHSGHEYPAGAVLSLVTWSQKEDRNWYGGSIPAKVQSIDKITYSANPGGSAVPLYEHYAGKPLNEITKEDSLVVKKRMSVVFGMRASVMP